MEERAKMHNRLIFRKIDRNHSRISFESCSNLWKLRIFCFFFFLSVLLLLLLVDWSVHFVLFRSFFFFLFVKNARSERGVVFRFLNLSKGINIYVLNILKWSKMGFKYLDYRGVDIFGYRWKFYLFVHYLFLCGFGRDLERDLFLKLLN